MRTAKSDNIAPAFDRFLRQALPRDGAENTLVLGERHNSSEHIQWLSDHLDALKDTYGVTTIGQERNAYLNVFLWSYQNGTLEKALGSKEKAQNYVRMMFRVHSAFPADAVMIADLDMAAIGKGIRVVAFDSRDTLESKKMGDQKFIEKWEGFVKKQAEENNMSVKEYQQAMRCDEKKMEAAMMVMNDLGKPTYLAAPVLTELDWLLSIDPEAKEKFDAQEALIELGHKKIDADQLTSDGLSATLFHAAAARGNHLTISGSSHINGIGNPSREHGIKREMIHGTFGHHLFSVGQSANQQRPHKVTQAVIATTAVIKWMNNIARVNFTEPNGTAVKDTSVETLNLDTKKVGKMWQPSTLWGKIANHKRIIALEDKFTLPSNLSDDEHKAYKASHVNPLLMPDIKAAADAVSAIMNGSQRSI